MHIPDGFLNLPAVLTTNGIAIAFIIPAVKKINNTMTPKRIPLMGLLAAFVFTIQLISFPVFGGTSVHIMGAVLISILVGPFSGLVVITASIFLQAFFFQHGGMLTLGANIINNGIIGCIGGYMLFKLLSKNIFLGAGISSFFTIITSSIFCGLMLGLSGMIDFKTGMISMITAHIFAGLIEVFVTISILGIIKKVRPDLLGLEKI